MTFCPNCGEPATPETRFCPKCGATIAAPAEPAAPPQAPYRPHTQIEVPPQAPYHAPTQMDVPPPGGGYSYPPPASYPPPGPPPPPPGGMYPPPPVPSGYVTPGYTTPVPEAPKGRSKAPLVILVVLVLLAAAAGVLFATHVIRWPFGSSGPKDAIEQAHTAYQKKDAATFDKYVDLKSVLSDFFDQVAAAGGLDAQKLTEVKFALPQITEIYKHIFFGTPTTAPDAMVQSMTPVSAQLQKLTYQGVDGDPVYSSDRKEATVKVKILDSSETPAKTKTVELKLKDTGTNWQVVAALNLKSLDPTMVSPPASNGPKEAVDQARKAYADKDVALFDKYVDLESLISDYFDQMAAAGDADATTVTTVKATLPVTSGVVKSIFFGTPTNAPPEVVQAMTPGFEQMRAGLQKLAYEGIADQQINGSEAIVKVKLMDASGAAPKSIVLELKMKDMGPNWRIVAAPNLHQMSKQ